MSDLNAGNLSAIRKSFAGLAKMPAALDPPMDRLFEGIADKARHLVQVDSGELREAIEAVTPHGSHKGPKTWAVVVDSDHAAAEEYGTHDQLAHPFFRPAVASANVEQTARSIIGNAVATSIRRAGS